MERNGKGKDEVWEGIYRKDEEKRKDWKEAR